MYRITLNKFKKTERRAIWTISWKYLSIIYVYVPFLFYKTNVLVISFFKLNAFLFRKPKLFLSVMFGYKLFIFCLINFRFIEVSNITEETFIVNTWCQKKIDTLHIIKLSKEVFILKYVWQTIWVFLFRTLH